MADTSAATATATAASVVLFFFAREKLLFRYPIENPFSVDISQQLQQQQQQQQAAAAAAAAASAALQSHASPSSLTVPDPTTPGTAISGGGSGVLASPNGDGATASPLSATSMGSGGAAVGVSVRHKKKTKKALLAAAAAGGSGDGGEGARSQQRTASQRAPSSPTSVVSSSTTGASSPAYAMTSPLTATSSSGGGPGVAPQRGPRRGTAGQSSFSSPTDPSAMSSGNANAGSGTISSGGAVPSTMQTRRGGVSTGGGAVGSAASVTTVVVPSGVGGAAAAAASPIGGRANRSGGMSSVLTTSAIGAGGSVNASGLGNMAAMGMSSSVSGAITNANAAAVAGGGGGTGNAAAGMSNAAAVATNASSQPSTTTATGGTAVAGTTSAAAAASSSSSSNAATALTCVGIPTNALLHLLRASLQGCTTIHIANGTFLVFPLIPAQQRENVSGGDSSGLTLHGSRGGRKGGAGSNSSGGNGGGLLNDDEDDVSPLVSHRSSRAGGASGGRSPRAHSSAGAKRSRLRSSTVMLVVAMSQPDTDDGAIARFVQCFMNVLYREEQRVQYVSEQVDRMERLMTIWELGGAAAGDVDGGSGGGTTTTGNSGSGGGGDKRSSPMVAGAAAGGGAGGSRSSAAGSPSPLLGQRLRASAYAGDIEAGFSQTTVPFSVDVEDDDPYDYLHSAMHSAGLPSHSSVVASGAMREGGGEGRGMPVRASLSQSPVYADSATGMMEEDGDGTGLDATNHWNTTRASYHHYDVYSGFANGGGGGSGLPRHPGPHSPPSPAAAGGGAGSGGLFWASRLRTPARPSTGGSGAAGSGAGSGGVGGAPRGSVFRFLADHGSVSLCEEIAAVAQCINQWCATLRGRPPRRRRWAAATSFTSPASGAGLYDGKGSVPGGTLTRWRSVSPSAGSPSPSPDTVLPQGIAINQLLWLPLAHLTGTMRPPDQLYSIYARLNPSSLVVLEDSFFVERLQREYAEVIGKKYVKLLPLSVVRSCLRGLAVPWRVGALYRSLERALLEAFTRLHLTRYVQQQQQQQAAAAAATTATAAGTSNAASKSAVAVAGGGPPTQPTAGRGSPSWHGMSSGSSVSTTHQRDAPLSSGGVSQKPTASSSVAEAAAAGSSAMNGGVAIFLNGEDTNAAPGAAPTRSPSSSRGPVIPPGVELDALHASLHQAVGLDFLAVEVIEFLRIREAITVESEVVVWFTHAPVMAPGWTSKQRRRLARRSDKAMSAAAAAARGDNGGNVEVGSDQAASGGTSINVYGPDGVCASRSVSGPATDGCPDRAKEGDSHVTESSRQQEKQKYHRRSAPLTPTSLILRMLERAQLITSDGGGHASPGGGGTGGGGELDSRNSSAFLRGGSTGSHMQPPLHGVGTGGQPMPGTPSTGNTGNNFPQTPNTPSEFLDGGGTASAVTAAAVATTAVGGSGGPGYRTGRPSHSHPPSVTLTATLAPGAAMGAPPSSAPTSSQHLHPAAPHGPTNTAAHSTTSASVNSTPSLTHLPVSGAHQGTGTRASGSKRRGGATITTAAAAAAAAATNTSSGTPSNAAPVHIAQPSGHRDDSTPLRIVSGGSGKPHGSSSASYAAAAAAASTASGGMTMSSSSPAAAVLTLTVYCAWGSACPLCEELAGCPACWTVPCGAAEVPVALHFPFLDPAVRECARHEIRWRGLGGGGGGGVTSAGSGSGGGSGSTGGLLRLPAMRPWFLMPDMFMAPVNTHGVSSLQMYRRLTGTENPTTSSGGGSATVQASAAEGGPSKHATNHPLREHAQSGDASLDKAKEAPRSPSRGADTANAHSQASPTHASPHTSSSSPSPPPTATAAGVASRHSARDVRRSNELCHSHYVRDEDQGDSVLLYCDTVAPAAAAWLRRYAGVITERLTSSREQRSAVEEDVAALVLGRRRAHHSAQQQQQKQKQQTAPVTSSSSSSPPHAPPGTTSAATTRRTSSTATASGAVAATSTAYGVGGVLQGSAEGCDPCSSTTALEELRLPEPATTCASAAINANLTGTSASSSRSSPRQQTNHAPRSMKYSKRLLPDRSAQSPLPLHASLLPGEHQTLLAASMAPPPPPPPQAGAAAASPTSVAFTSSVARPSSASSIGSPTTAACGPVPCGGGDASGRAETDNGSAHSPLTATSPLQIGSGRSGLYDTAASAPTTTAMAATASSSSTTVSRPVLIAPQLIGSTRYVPVEVLLQFTLHHLVAITWGKPGVDTEAIVRQLERNLRRLPLFLAHLPYVLQLRALKTTSKEMVHRLQERARQKAAEVETHASGASLSKLVESAEPSPDAREAAATAAAGPTEKITVSSVKETASAGTTSHPQESGTAHGDALTESTGNEKTESAAGEGGREKAKEEPTIAQAADATTAPTSTAESSDNGLPTAFHLDVQLLQACELYEHLGLMDCLMRYIGMPVQVVPTRLLLHAVVNEFCELFVTGGGSGVSRRPD